MSKQARTLEEVVARLDGLVGGDVESDHTEADYLLLDALLIMGCWDIVDAYRAAKDRVGFWYA